MIALLGSMTDSNRLRYIRRFKTLLAGPQPYKPYEAEVTNFNTITNITMYSSKISAWSHLENSRFSVGHRVKQKSFIPTDNELQ